MIDPGPFTTLGVPFWAVWLVVWTWIGFDTVRFLRWFTLNTVTPSGFLVRLFKGLAVVHATAAMYILLYLLVY